MVKSRDLELSKVENKLNALLLMEIQYAMVEDLLKIFMKYNSMMSSEIFTKNFGNLLAKTRDQNPYKIMKVQNV